MTRIFSLAVLLLLAIACKNTQESDNTAAQTTEESTENAITQEPLKLSLAQWSLHHRYQADGANPFNFAKDAKELGFDAIEIVTQLYDKQIDEMGFNTVVDSLKSTLDANGVSCVLIMVDNEGDLADPDDAKRNEAVENHKKWVDATDLLGGHSIRVNAFGTNDPAVWRETIKDGLIKLSKYASSRGINVLVENHGWLSSNADLLMEVLDEIDMPNCGTLPDFGNWCVKRVEESRWGACEEEYPDYYKGVELMLSRASAVSAKSYSFDEEGNETKIDYQRMVDLVKASGYTGHIGIEFEGSDMDEPTGIKATRDLLLSVY